MGCKTEVPRLRQGSRTGAALVAGILIIHAGMLLWGAARQSPTWGEVGFLPAGISHWRFGRFDLFAVNPPLVRVVATVPLLVAQPEVDWSEFSPMPTALVPSKARSSRPNTMPPGKSRPLSIRWVKPPATPTTLGAGLFG